MGFKSLGKPAEMEVVKKMTAQEKNMIENILIDIGLEPLHPAGGGENSKTKTLIIKAAH